MGIYWGKEKINRVPDHFGANITKRLSNFDNIDHDSIQNSKILNYRDNGKACRYKPQAKT